MTGRRSDLLRCFDRVVSLFGTVSVDQLSTLIYNSATRAGMGKIALFAQGLASRLVIGGYVLPSGNCVNALTGPGRFPFRGVRMKGKATKFMSPSPRVMGYQSMKAAGP